MAGLASLPCYEGTVNSSKAFLRQLNKAYVPSPIKGSIRDLHRGDVLCHARPGIGEDVDFAGNRTQLNLVT